MKRFILLFAILLAACAPKAPTPENETPPEVPVAQEQAMEHDMMDMDDDHHMMMETKALKWRCPDLVSLSIEEKAELLHEIAHNMDKDALDIILDSCPFLEDIEEVSVVTDNELKLNPNDDEVLYFTPETNQFFLTCSSMNTLAYVVDMEDKDETPEDYFAKNRKHFADAATMMKEMMAAMGMKDDMGDMHDMNDMEDMMDDEAGDESGPEAEYEEEAMGNPGMYVESAYTNVALANSALSDGENSLLFFYASWCGYCQSKDKILKSMYGSEEFATSTYKVDYDTAADLKGRYGITTQDTFVLIDGEGNALQTVVGASESDLRSLLSS